jgi:addiction module HigA family antidote
MEQYQLSPFSLSKEIGLSPSSVRQIVIGKSKVTVATAYRLAKYFGQTPVYWLDLQRAVDIQEADKDKELQDTLKSIKKAGKPSTAVTVKDQGKAPKTTDKTPGKKTASRGRKPKAP